MQCPRRLLVVLGVLASAIAASADGLPLGALLAELPFLEASENDPDKVHIDLAPEGSARPLPFQLDTGANVSVMTPGAARERGVRTRRIKMTPYHRETRLGREVHFWVNTRRGDGFGRGGVEYALLGGDFLSRYVVEIDYPERRVRFLDPDRVSVPEEPSAPDTTVLPMRVVSHRPQVRVEIAGREVPVLVDTGGYTGLALSGEVAARLGIESEPDDVDAWGAWGPIETETAEIAEVRLGGFVLRDLQVTVLPHGLYNMGMGNDSLIGAALLRDFVVRLDYPRRRLWLGRPAGPGPDEAAAPTSPEPPEAPDPS